MFAILIDCKILKFIKRKSVCNWKFQRVYRDNGTFANLENSEIFISLQEQLRFKRTFCKSKKIESL